MSRTGREIALAHDCRRFAVALPRAADKVAQGAFEPMTTRPNYPAPGKAGIARLLTIEHRCSGLPEPCVGLFSLSAFNDEVDHNLRGLRWVRLRSGAFGGRQGLWSSGSGQNRSLGFRRSFHFYGGSVPMRFRYIWARNAAFSGIPRRAAPSAASAPLRLQLLERGGADLRIGVAELADERVVLDPLAAPPLGGSSRRLRARRRAPRSLVRQPEPVDALGAGDRDAGVDHQVDDRAGLFAQERDEGVVGPADARRGRREGPGERRREAPRPAPRGYQAEPMAPRIGRSRPSFSSCRTLNSLAKPSSAAASRRQRWSSKPDGGLMVFAWRRLAWSPTIIKPR